MDKNAIKKFAVWARRELISRVSQRAAYYDITEAGFGDPAADSILGRVLSAEEKPQRQALIAQIRQKGYQQVMEEVAYTWFNRFIALRFMEVNGYLPSHVRVFTDEDNQFKPQILAEAIHIELDGLDMQKVYAFKNANDDDGLFKYMVIIQCNALSSILPGMFQRISDYTELLFPDNLLREGSILQQMIEMIPEEDWKDAVQIIGWLYQYYNAEKKDEVFAALKKNVKIAKENIPAATQLFTPDWIVRYMVENSLGRLWLEHLAATGEGYHYSYGEYNAATYINADKVKELKTNWKYYLEEAEQEPGVQVQLAEIRKEYAAMTPEQIKCIDPCCGSGHILAYLFDVLMQIYESYGYTTREAVASIVQNNLYGLDIDDRAAQLAYFAVMMKARQYDRRFFSRKIQPNVYAIQESNGVDHYTLEYFYNGDVKLKAAMDSIVEEMHDAKEYGSILNITHVDFVSLYDRFDEVQNDVDISRETVLNDLLPLVRVAEVLAQKYDVVVTNPPYRGVGHVRIKLQDFVKAKYPSSCSDLSTVFMEKCISMAKGNGYYAMINIPVWMSLASYSALRAKMLTNEYIVNMLHLGRGMFGSDYGTTAFVVSNRSIADYKGLYCKFFEKQGTVEPEEAKQKKFFMGTKKYITKQSLYFSLPNNIIAYWANESFAEAFEAGVNINTYATVFEGLKTRDKDRFLRFWFEVVSKKWVPYAKGGAFRRWYGNNDYVVNWGNNGDEVRNFKKSSGANFQHYFEPAITYTAMTMSGFTGRYISNQIFGGGGGGITASSKIDYLLAFVNSVPFNYIISAMKSTVNFEVGQIGKIPVLFGDSKSQKMVEALARENVILSKSDWDSYEYSWNFQIHPLVRLKEKMAFNAMDGDSKIASYFLQGAYRAWKNECEEHFAHLKTNEEELNRIFINIYGLQDELDPVVADKDVTVHYLVDTKEDIPASLQGSNYILTRRDVIVSLLSYAVGCMFGRYSLDVDGLAYAGGDWNAVYRMQQEIYTVEGKEVHLADGRVLTVKPTGYNQIKTDDGWKTLSYPVDADNVIPICDDEYFDDDMVGRFVKFIETVYGSDTLEENLKFIADALGGKGTPRDVIRSYFLNDFYADHCKTYQKRPIYWLFDSGKKNGFKALIYMHRYQPDIIARIRTDYVHEQQSRYRTAIADLESRIASASTAERVKLNKQLKKLQEQDAELRTYEEKIHHLADKMTPIDLDDGVKVNYAKFQDVLAKIK